ncbi:MAG: transporter substrate-binding domain-containing protein [Pseudomonadota bacterium]
MKQIKTGMKICFFLGLCLLISTLASGQKEEELKLVTQDFQPFSYMENGSVAGPAVEIIHEVCAKINITPLIKLYPWRRAQAMVEEGSAHGMFVIGWNQKRSEWLYFSPPILNTEYGFFVRDDNPLEFKTLSDVEGYTVGAFGPSNTSRSLETIKEQVPSITLDITPDDESCFRKLDLGRVSAVYSNKNVGFALIRKLGFKNIRYAGCHRTLQYYIGFSQQYNDKATIHRFNQAFLDLHKQGKIQEILKRYLMEPAQIKY